MILGKSSHNILGQKVNLPCLLMPLLLGWQVINTHSIYYSAQAQILTKTEPGPRFNIKMTSYQYRKSHCGDKTIWRPSYLHNGISYTGKMTSLYWIRALICTTLALWQITYEVSHHTVSNCGRFLYQEIIPLVISTCGELNMLHGALRHC